MLLWVEPITLVRQSQARTYPGSAAFTFRPVRWELAAASGILREGSSSVDDSEVVGASRSTESQNPLTGGRSSFNDKHLRSTEFNRVQPLLESGSGPGGRRFKSSLPDQSFQILKLHFWVSIYIDGVDFVDGACILELLFTVRGAKNESYRHSSLGGSLSRKVVILGRQAATQN
jgi:hypothetical protein